MNNYMIGPIARAFAHLPVRYLAEGISDALRDPLEQELEDGWDAKLWSNGGMPNARASEEPDLEPGPARAGEAPATGEQPQPLAPPMLAAALDLAKKHGWKLFPARMEDGKKYSWLSKEHATGGENWGMTSDPEQLRRNFLNAKWRLKCGVGVPTGWVNRIIDIEADTKEGHDVDGLASLQALEAKHGRLPETLMAESPTGSPHRIYKHPGHGIKVISRSLPGYPGVDIKGDGGMFVAPPSVRSDGEYRWLNDSPIADAPQWLIDLVTAKGNGKSAAPASARAGGAAEPPRLKLAEAFKHLEVKSLAEGIEHPTADIEEIRSAASAIPPSAIATEPEWMAFARALAWESKMRPERSEALWEILDAVSRQAPGYNQEDNRRKFDRYIDEAGTGEKTNTIATLFFLAREHGWLPGQVIDGGVKLEDFYAYMPMHNYIFAPSREPWPVASVNARIPPVVISVADDGKEIEIKASTWIDRHQPVEMMTWAPGMPMIIADRLIAEGGWIERKGVSCFNLYRPPTIPLGDRSKAWPWVKLVYKVYPEDAAHIIKWFAWRRQRPEVKINHALVLGSNEQGIGKDTILEGPKRAVGPWNFKEVAPKNMFDDFNPWRRAVILRVSEAKDMGDVSRFELYDGMKTLLAAPPDVLECNEKYIKQHYVINCVGVVITTNYLTNGIYLPAEDRRHYVAWSTCKPADFAPDFWFKMWRWYNEGGDRHVAAFLSAVDISDFDPKAAPPKTSAFWSIVNANRTAEEGELQDVLDKLDNPDAVTIEQLKNGTSEYSLAAWLGERKNRKAANHRLETCGYRAVNNPVAKDGLWRIDERRQMVYAKVTLSLGAQQKAAETLQNEAAEEKKRRKEDADNELDAEVERLLGQKIEAVAENKGPE